MEIAAGILASSPNQEGKGITPTNRMESTMSQNSTPLVLVVSANQNMRHRELSAINQEMISSGMGCNEKHQ
jgi:hypothetical protein